MKPLPIGAVSVYSDPAEDSPTPLRQLVREICPEAPRRVNRLTELGLIGAHRCVVGRPVPEETPLYMAFSSGCIADSAALVKQAVRDEPLMPVAFINVSSNMSGFYIAGSLDLRSPNHAIASNDFAWEATLELAALATARCVLVGAVEECAWPLAEHRRRLGLPLDARILETSHWLLIDRDVSNPRAVINWVRRFADLTAATVFLHTQAWPSTEVALGPGLAGRAGDVLPMLPRWDDSAAPGYVGMPSADTCCRFIEKRRQASLLHVNRGADGAVYVVYLSTQ